MWVLKVIAVGFFTAIGWHGADHYVIQPYLKSKTEIEVQNEDSN